MRLLQGIKQGGSNMTGTDLCVNKPQSVLVIFEPPCTLHNQRQNENITGMKYSLIFKVQQSQF